MNYFKSTLLSTLVASCLAAGHSGAAVIAQQEFNGTANGSTGFNGNAFNQGTTVTGLTYPSLVTAGDARIIGGTPQLSLSAGNRSSTATYFLSYLIDSSTSAGTPTTENRKGLTLFASGFNDGNNPTDPGALPNGGGGGTELVEFGVRFGTIGYSQGNYGPGNTFAYVSSGTIETASTHLYVVRVNTNASTLSANISFFFDPTALDATPLQTFNVPSFHLEQLRAYAFSGTFDEFRVGDTFADVAPGLAASGVPEPSTYGLLGLGGVLAFAVRRKFRSSSMA